MHFPRNRSRALVVLLAGSLSLTAVVSATEDGTGGITPEDILTCQIVPAAWQSAPAATPMASPVSSPVASPMPEQAVDLLTADLTTATDSILNCMSENNTEALIRITGPDFRGTWLGFGTTMNDADFAALLPMLPKLSYELVSIENAAVEGDIATATVNYTVGRQLLSSQWTYALTEANGKPSWQVQTEIVQAGVAPEGAANVDLAIADGSFTFSASPVQGTDIVINVTNTGSQPHEVLVMRVPEGVGASQIAAAPTGIPVGATFIAQATVPAGEEGTVILTNLLPGTYTVVDLLPDASGIPNVSSGMITTFEVVAP